MEQTREHTRAKGLAKAALLLALLLLAVAGGAFGYAAWLKGQPGYPPRADPNVQVGTPENGAAALEELQRQVDEGMLTFGINATAAFENGASLGNLMIENPKENGSKFAVTVVRADTEETVYRSGTLEPGQYLENVTLDTALEKGEYPCTAYFDAYSLTDDTYLGRAAAEITLYILE